MNVTLRHHASMRTAAVRLAAFAAATSVAAIGCRRDVSDLDSIFYSGGRRPVHCATNLDTKANLSLADIDSALNRAADRREVVELYAHHPGITVPVETIEYVLAGAAQRGLAFVTYADFTAGLDTGPGIALSFDDTSVTAWHALLPAFARVGARVTFFVSRYAALQDSEHALLHELAAAGHDVEPHTVHHYNGPAYVEENGVGAYLRDEIQPSIDALTADGYQVHAFAYPFGARTSETDDAILEHVPILRSITFPNSTGSTPCPL